MIQIETGYHRPVMLSECLQHWLGENPGVYVDCTTGGGGHSLALLQKLQPTSVLHCLDRDPEALEHAMARFGELAEMVQPHLIPFSRLQEVAAPSSVDGILYDLGISSHQIDEAYRGFTFLGDAPLDLRMNQQQGESAQQWLRSIELDDFAAVLGRNSDLDRAKTLARAILQNVAATEGDIKPAQIRDAVSKVFPDKPRDQNSLLARVLQAIRMELNHEMEEVRSSILAAVSLLKSGGHLCVLSYHSVEDRTVKQTLVEMEMDCICPSQWPICQCGGGRRRVRKVLRKPQGPSEEEMRENNRSRSAKLRVYQRV